MSWALAAQEGDSPEPAEPESPPPAAVPAPSDDSVEFTGPELLSTQVVTRAADGTLSYECLQEGDHSTHVHAAPPVQEALR